MNVGFYTSTFNDRPFSEVVDFAVGAGFEAIEIDVGGHIKTPDQVAPVVEQARQAGLYVSSVTFFGNQMEPDAEKRKALRTLTLELAQAVGEAKVPIFVFFPGRDNTKPDHENYDGFAEHAKSLLAATVSSGLDFAIENWPGPNDDFIATTPEGWHQLLSRIPDTRFGLEFDPSHLIRLGIDPYAAFDQFKDRLKILHAKDTSIDQAKLQEVGYHGRGWWRYRLPGNGLLDWKRFLTQAKSHGFDGTISIEHEDSDYGWPRKDLDARKEGERIARAFLDATLAAL